MQKAFKVLKRSFFKNPLYKYIVSYVDVISPLYEKKGQFVCQEVVPVHPVSVEPEECPHVANEMTVFATCGEKTAGSPKVKTVLNCFGTFL